MNPIVIIVVLLVVALFLTLTILASMFQKVGPNEALIVSGFGGTKVVHGGGRVVWPLVQTSQTALARADVLRCRAAAGAVHEAGRRAQCRGGLADQSQE